MAQIKTVTTTSGENTITLDSFYPYVWIRNSDDNDITAANYSGASAGDENTVSIKAGEVAMIQAETENIYIIGATTAEIHAQGFAECPFKRTAKGGEQIDVTALSVTTNGTYTAPTGTAYSPVTVDVQEQPWEPLEDGYSNFWFEITNDTLSPWLNFSAKNANAVIDWGDGSGEVALDTLTPTHTYSKAGKYVVKCKGVTGIGQQHAAPLNPDYFGIIQYVELNNDVVNLGASAFNYCTNLKRCIFNNTFNSFGGNVFSYCANLEILNIPNGTTTIQGSTIFFSPKLKELTFPSTVTVLAGYAIRYCTSLKSIIFPAAITEFGNSSFATTPCLEEIHMLSTTPPTLGTNNFTSMPSNYIIYVPVGTGETYKAAAGWSAYADHILEEGQTVTRAMQSKFKKEAEKSDNNEIEMR